jgi:hypothetical protein
MMQARQKIPSQRMIAPLFMLPAATGGRGRIQSQYAERERSEEITAYKPAINP